MMLHPVGAYLSRFEEKTAIFDTPSVETKGDAENPIGQIEDPAKIYRALIESAVDDIRGELGAEYEQKLKGEKKRFQESLTLERQRWVAEEGERLASAFDSSLRGSINELTGAMERILAPFVAREMLESLLADFVGTVQNVISRADQSVVRLSGPSDLLDIVERQLAVRSIAVSRMNGSGDELLVQVDLTAIETNISYWMNQIGGLAHRDG